MKRSHAIRFILLGLGALLLYFSVEFQDLEQRRAQARIQQFNAADYARDFWDNRLPGILKQGVDAQVLIRLFNTDMPAAIKQGKTLGESRVHAYLIQGQGRVVAQNKKGLMLSVADPEDQPEILIRTGAFVSGNAVRDASGNPATAADGSPLGTRVHSFASADFGITSPADGASVRGSAGAG